MTAVFVDGIPTGQVLASVVKRGTEAKVPLAWVLEHMTRFAWDSIADAATDFFPSSRRLFDITPMNPRHHAGFDRQFPETHGFLSPQDPTGIYSSTKRRCAAVKSGVQSYLRTDRCARVQPG